MSNAFKNTVSLDKKNIVAICSDKSHFKLLYGLDKYVFITIKNTHRIIIYIIQIVCVDSLTSFSSEKIFLRGVQ